MEMIHESPPAIHCIRPRPIRVLSARHEAEVTLRCLHILRLRQFDSSLGQEKSTIGAGVYYSATVMWQWRVAAACSFESGFQISIISQSVAGNGLHDCQPTRIMVQAIDLRKSFVHVRCGGDQRYAAPNCAIDRLPVEWVSPSVFLQTGATGSFEHRQKMSCPLQPFLLSTDTRKKRESHGVMRVSDRKSLPLPK